MNICLILSGGVGKRFGAPIPKQYCTINGKAVIDYVIEACLAAKSVDKIIVVCNYDYLDMSAYLNTDKVEITHNGKERYDSLNNGLEYIKANYKCDNILFLDAVGPLVYPELIDDYFAKLDEYECVLTCKKVTGEIGNYDFDVMDRNAYYLFWSPESFRFNLVTKYFDPNFFSSALVYQMPKTTKRYLNFDFKEHIKITYDFELIIAKELLEHRAAQKDKNNQ